LKDDVCIGVKKPRTGVGIKKEKDKYLHPKYAPVNRYASDIIGCLNNWVDGCRLEYGFK
jgi:glucosylceramidase